MNAPLYSELSYPGYGSYDPGYSVGEKPLDPLSYAANMGTGGAPPNAAPLPAARQATPSGVAEPAPFNASAISNANPVPSPASFPETQITPGQRTISPYDDGPGAVSQIGEITSGVGDITTAAGAIPGPQQPFVAGAGLALKGIGTVASIYGKYQDRQDAKDRYADTLEQWETSERERKEDKAQEAKRADRQEGYFAADYAKDTTDYFANSYPGQRTPGGQ